MLTQPIVTGDPLAAPAVPPTYCWKSVTPPVAPLPELAGDEEAELADVLAAALAGAVFAGVELELDVELELQAAAPTTRTAPKAAKRHLELTLIRRDIPALRTIAPSRLSAVNSPVSGPSSARSGGGRRHTELIDQ
jgi:hypothetical protein